MNRLSQQDRTRQVRVCASLYFFQCRRFLYTFMASFSVSDIISDVSICIFVFSKKKDRQKSPKWFQSLHSLKMIHTRRRIHHSASIFSRPVIYGVIVIALLSFILFVHIFLDILWIGSTYSTNDGINLLRICWEDDRDTMEKERLRTGFGEKGEVAFLTDPLDIIQNEKLFKEYGMSLLISDRM